jgi:branched-chain amino acid transport system ATP-binding protein
MSFLVVKNLLKTFEGITAVNNLSFNVKKNDIFAIIGPNGAGKTTTFNLLSGVLRADRGEIHFNGDPIIGLKPYQIASRGVVRTFQSVNLFDNMTVIDNVKVGCHKKAQSEIFAAALRTRQFRQEEQYISRKAYDTLQLIGLESRAGEMAGNLPFGQQRLLEIARSLAGDPELLLLDEPAAGLNAHETSELAALILKLQSQGITIVIIEHDMELVMEISNNIIVLDQGVKIAEGTPKHIQSNKTVIAAYLGEEY